MEKNIIEEILTIGPRLSFSYVTELCNVKTNFQEIRIVDLGPFGKGLFIDNLIQFCELDEFLYHERLALLPMFLSKKIDNVLILGGGDGLAAREILKFKDVTSVTIVELDVEVLNVCSKYFSDINLGVFDNPKLKIVVEDCRNFLLSSDLKYDLVIIDLLDPDADDSLMLYKEVIGLVKNVMSPSSIVSSFAGEASGPTFMIAKFVAEFNKTFNFVNPHHQFVESFAQDCGFIIASDSKIKVPLEERVNQVDSQSMDINIARHTFLIPPYLMREIKNYSDK